MSIIPDAFDAQGMYSKAGRFTSEKYIVFQKKDEILHNKVRYAKTSMMPEIPLQKEKPKQPFFTSVLYDQILFIKDNNNKDDKTKLIKNKKSDFQPFSKQTSRDKVQKIRLDKNQPPPCGYYHPKFSELDVKPQLVFDYTISQKKTTPRLVQTNSVVSLDDMLKPIPEKMRHSNTCLYEMSRQVARGDSLFKGHPEPHEKRFENLQLTDAWSKIPRTPSVPIGSILARDQMIIYKQKKFAPDYQPNSEFGKRQLGSCGAPFQKNSKRGELFKKPSNYNHEAYFEYDRYVKSPKSQIFPTALSPNFHKMLNREQDCTSPLPSFMQKYVNMRLTLTHLHQKMLERNNFMEGRFQTATSSFGKFRKKVKKHATLSEEDLFDGEEDQNNEQY